ncbi:choice-of-anchor M domain-containing protein [Actinoalloteichus spitiensis]|uniref:choice-of-anchor M domain-containing protein n=1 Tax=Actinoalloteichus spitiensis TaxID=252394 RepID=UPI0012F6B3CA|nr:choice-of-anchor M domain-containing protein [Actinoalloteichus spitiensis]
MHVRNRVGVGAVAVAAAALLAGATPAYAQTTLSEGHVDVIDVHLHGDHFHVHVHAEDLGQSFEPSEVVFEVNDNAAGTITAESAFVGAPVGSAAWVLPAEATDGVLFAGFSAHDLAPGDTDDDQVHVALTGVSGPGDIGLWDADDLSVVFNSFDGLDSEDVLTLGPDAHYHPAWVFTDAGQYFLTFEVSALVGGTTITDEATLEFVVG